MIRCEHGPREGKPRGGQRMLKADEVEAMLGLHALGWGTRRIAEECSASIRMRSLILIVAEQRAGPCCRRRGLTATKTAPQSGPKARRHQPGAIRAFELELCIRTADTIPAVVPAKAVEALIEHILIRVSGPSFSIRG